MTANEEAEWQAYVKEELTKIRDRGTAIVAHYINEHDPGEDPETAMSDLLADLMHAADANELDFEGLRRRAHQHYVAELHGDL